MVVSFEVDYGLFRGMESNRNWKGKEKLDIVLLNGKRNYKRKKKKQREKTEWGMLVLLGGDGKLKFTG